MTTVHRPAPKRRLLVVQDDHHTGKDLAASLRAAGFEVHAAGDSDTAVRLARQLDPDLVVLPGRDPDSDGFTVTGRLTGSGRELPVVFATAADPGTDQTSDGTGGGTGGTGRHTASGDARELIARIRTVLGPTRAQPADGFGGPSTLRFADLELDEEPRQVRRAGRLIAVSPTEFALLRYLMLNPNRVLSRTQILRQVWDHDAHATPATVETYISYLRRKLHADGQPRLIHTRRGLGYQLRATPPPV